MALKFLMVWVENSGSIHSCLVSFRLVMSPTFMLGIWHKGDWLKRDLAQPVYVQVENIEVRYLIGF